MKSLSIFAGLALAVVMAAPAMAGDCVKSVQGEGNRANPNYAQGEGNRANPNYAQGEGNRANPNYAQGEGNRANAKYAQAEGNKQALAQASGVPCK